MRGSLYWNLVLVLTPLSMISLGGGQSVVADIDKQVVDIHHWMSQAEFVNLFAIARAAPGPGALLSTLVGWHVDGFDGALVATLAYFGPSSLIAFGVARIWNRFDAGGWKGIFERALAPVATGLILAGGFTILSASAGATAIWLTAAASAAIFVLRPKLNPLIVLGAGGLASVAFGALA
jgi:chromate transporter